MLYYIRVDKMWGSLLIEVEYSNKNRVNVAMERKQRETNKEIELWKGTK